MLFSPKRFIIIANDRENVREKKNMKRCPQCNSVFDNSLDFCTNDGTPLIQETFVLPSESSAFDAEEVTVIHSAPVTINIPNQNPPVAPTEQFNYQVPITETVIVKKPRNTGKYLLFMVLGLLLGGGLVLAAVLFVMFLNQKKQPAQVNINVNKPIISTPTVKETPTATPITASAKHEKRTDTDDDEFNGRVISQNAFVHAAPNRNSKQTDVLPVDDRLNIEERENESSPWFRVTCEHGTSGWMHGNTIEYTH